MPNPFVQYQPYGLPQWPYQGYLVPPLPQFPPPQPMFAPPPPMYHPTTDDETMGTGDHQAIFVEKIFQTYASLVFKDPIKKVDKTNTDAYRFQATNYPVLQSSTAALGLPAPDNFIHHQWDIRAWAEAAERIQFGPILLDNDQKAIDTGDHQATFSEKNPSEVLPGLLQRPNKEGRQNECRHIVSKLLTIRLSEQALLPLDHQHQVKLDIVNGTLEPGQRRQQRNRADDPVIRSSTVVRCKDGPPLLYFIKGGMRAGLSLEEQQNLPNNSMRAIQELVKAYPPNWPAVNDSRLTQNAEAQTEDNSCQPKLQEGFRWHFCDLQDGK